MVFIDRFKIGRMTPKANFTYPVVRLPTDYAGIIGQYVSIYETKDEAGRCVFTLVLEGDNDSILPERVARRNITRGIENRLSVMEVEMNGMKKSLETLVKIMEKEPKGRNQKGQKKQEVV
nr:hypothetical protein [uncultured Methanoregula sp.]